MLSAGTNVEWLRDDLGVLATSAESHDVAAGVETTDGVGVRPGPARARHAGLGLRRPRHAARRHPRDDAGPPRAGRAGGRRPPRRRPRRGRRGRHRAVDRRAARRRRDERQPDVHPGRRRRDAAGRSRCRRSSRRRRSAPPSWPGWPTGVWGDIGDADRVVETRPDRTSPARRSTGTLWHARRRAGRGAGSPSCPLSTSDVLYSAASRVSLTGRRPWRPIPTPSWSGSPAARSDWSARRPSAPGGIRRVPPSGPTAADVELLGAVQAVELTARDLYQAAIDAGADDDVYVRHPRQPPGLRRRAVRADRTRGPGSLRNEALYEEQVGASRHERRASWRRRPTTSSRRSSPPTPTLLGELEGVDGAQADRLDRSWSRPATRTVLADLAGNGDDLDALFDNTAEPLDLARRRAGMSAAGRARPARRSAVAACSRPVAWRRRSARSWRPAASETSGDDAPGRVGYAPPATPLPTVEINDVVYLRTATSIEYLHARHLRHDHRERQTRRARTRR